MPSAVLPARKLSQSEVEPLACGVRRQSQRFSELFDSFLLSCRVLVEGFAQGSDDA